MKIDTDKYEGHTEGEWVFKHINSNWYQCDKIGEIHMEDIAIKEASANAQLIADAPLLLAEVKRLRDRIERAKKILCYSIQPENGPNYYLDLAHERSLQMSAAADVLEGNE